MNIFGRTANERRLAVFDDAGLTSPCFDVPRKLKKCLWRNAVLRVAKGLLCCVSECCVSGCELAVVCLCFSMIA